MTQEPDQLPAPDAGSAAPAGTKATGSKQGIRPRAGVPVWRTGKPDAFLAAAVDVARTAVEGIAPAWQVGKHLGARTESSEGSRPSSSTVTILERELRVRTAYHCHPW